MPRSLARHGWLIAIAVTYFYVFPYFPHVNSANELPRLYLVKAIAEDHSFTIERGAARWGVEEGGGPTADITRFGGHSYSNKAPGSSMLVVAPYLAAELVAGEPELPTAMWICRVFGGVIPMLLFLMLLYRFLERYAPDPAIRQLVCLAYGLGSMAMTYSVLYFSHQLAAICVASAWMIGLQSANRERGIAWFGVAGALAGASALVDYQAVFAAVPAAIHLVVKLRGWHRRELAVAIGIATAAAIVPIVILLGYHAVCFGSPWRTGYGAVASDGFDASIAFASNHQEGFLGLTKLRWEAFVGSLFDLDNGLFALSPWWLIALPGMVWLWRGDRERPRDRGTAAVSVAVLVIYVLFVSAIKFWRGGWGVGPRYITAMLPFLLPPIAVALVTLQRRDKRILGAVAGLIVVGVVIYTGSTVTFPYWPDTVEGMPVLHPVFDITFHLLADDLVAPNLGGAIGIGGVLGILPVLAVVVASIGIAIRRTAGTVGLACAIGVAVLVFAGYRLPAPDRNAARSYEAARAFVEPAAWDLRVFCHAQEWTHARDPKQLLAYWHRPWFSTDDIQPSIAAFERGTLDLAGLDRVVRDAMARVEVARCPTLDWLNSTRTRP